MKELPIFAGVTPAEFELITSAAREKHFSDGEIIFREGSPVREVALLVAGSVKITKVFSNAYSNRYEIRLETMALKALFEFMKAGARLRDVALLLPGTVKVTKISSNRKGVTLETIASGALVDFISAALIYRRTARRQTAQAAEACRMLVWDLAEFEELLRIRTFRTNVFEAQRQHLESLMQYQQEMQRRSHPSRQRMKPNTRA